MTIKYAMCAVLFALATPANAEAIRCEELLGNGKIKIVIDEKKGSSITVFGETQPAVCKIVGLKKSCWFGENDNHKLSIKPGGLTHYYDFTGAKTGETREPSMTFTCKMK